MSLCGHAQCVTCIRWGGEGLLYSSSQDRTIKVWRTKDVRACVVNHCLSNSLIECLTTKIILQLYFSLMLCVFKSTSVINRFLSPKGILCRSLEGHGHWVNTMALNTDYVLRTGAFEPGNMITSDRSLTSMCY